MGRKLRIAINAQLPSVSGTGGIETVLRVLTSLGQLEGDEEYIFIGHWADSGWLKSLMSERQMVVPAPPPSARTSSPLYLKNLRRFLRPLKPLLSKLKQSAASPVKKQIKIPVSDGFYESLGCDVIHFPYQDYVFCQMPSVYNPHDLQHLHYPQFFSREEIARREIIYPGACRAAQTVAVASEFVKQDIIQNYGIEAGKIQVIPWSPPKKSIKEISAEKWVSVSQKFEIPEKPFALYPAMTWEHKNHLRLLEAIARLRDRDNIRIYLICTGHKTDYYTQIERRLRELKLEAQVKFPGLVSPEELSALYFQAQFVIIPTLFEAASGPLFEAWQHNVAAACSSVTSLPEQAAGGAALLFNPFSIEEIADVLKRMNLDDNLRATLRTRGTARLQDFSLEQTAKTYRAVYRRAAGLTLNDEDRQLLETPPQDRKYSWNKKEPPEILCS